MSVSDGTIFALSSGAGRAGIAVLRLSGAGAHAAIGALAGTPLPEPRRAVLRPFRDPQSREVLDRGLLLWFPGPGSYTGEDMAELHLHGGRAVATGLIEALAALPGLRPAEPGEFTRRACANGRLDLTEAEGVADLIAAETAAQRRQALRQLDGALGGLYEGWRARLIETEALLEAAIDFSDQEVPEDVTEGVYPKIEGLSQEITQHLADDRRGERLREGFEIAILGPPNAGKSSLLNRLAERDAAIVAPSAGTTRDVIEVRLDLGGYPVILADTAGLREDAEGIEEEGRRRALERARRADLKLVVFDGTSWPELDGAARRLLDRDSIAVLNKRDLKAIEAPGTLVSGDLGASAVYGLSCVTGEGFEELLGGLEKAIEVRFAPGVTPALTRARHRAALEDCVAALGRYLETEGGAAGGGAAGGGAVELMAEDLRLAARALGRITGRVDVEDILDLVFRDFCIGK
ncbi:MAG: tRNA uridine-5-carboxymethylaminomethyl(34) synthesis GTPase MnmE [Alphaproteobacteria bacterium]